MTATPSVKWAEKHISPLETERRGWPWEKCIFLNSNPQAHRFPNTVNSETRRNEREDAEGKNMARSDYRHFVRRTAGFHPVLQDNRRHKSDFDTYFFFP